ncbi:META domain-containing protein [Microvirga puerhi]|uniref:META domain-containing protein n=1 Tax=Microvirga puerhi TaxID=2876078 RepID=A0ABS7VLT5_9HYPH|nr:META domain-containing protein [Microvirga puerhi]MBZ6076126.1 META domain-containing protein [Microvirga puerhi]
MNEVLMNALRLAALLAALAAVPAAHAQTSTTLGRPAGPTRTVDTKVPQPSQQDKIFPLRSIWTAVSLNGKPFTGDRPSFSLDDQLRARGFGGCNNYSATTYPLREQKLAVGPFALTKKTCDKATMASENAFLIALRTSNQWDITGPFLTIHTQSGELKFERAL